MFECCSTSCRSLAKRTAPAQDWIAWRPIWRGLSRGSDLSPEEPLHDWRDSIDPQPVLPPAGMEAIAGDERCVVPREPRQVENVDEGQAAIAAQLLQYRVELDHGRSARRRIAVFRASRRHRVVRR